MSKIRLNSHGIPYPKAVCGIKTAENMLKNKTIWTNTITNVLVKIPQLRNKAHSLKAFYSWVIIVRLPDRTIGFEP